MSRKRTRGRSGSPDQFLESRLFKFGTKLVIGLAVVVVFLTLTQCTVKKPESPTWTTQLTVPLVNRTYEMPEIIDKIDQEDILIGADSAVVFSLSRDIDTVSLEGDELTTDNMSYSVSEQLGEITIDAPVSDSVAVALADIGSLATYVPGAVPPLTFDVTNALQPIDNFSTATIANGRLWAVITNNLGFDLSAVTVQLYDAGNSRVVGSQGFVGGIADGVTDSVAFDLDGETISNQLEAWLSSATTGGTVLSAANKEITTAIRFDNSLTVSSATAEIPALSRNFSQQVGLGETDPVYAAHLTTGALSLEVANSTNLPANLAISFPDLVNSGTPLSVVRSIGANSNTTVNVDLSGYDLEPTDSTVPQNININVSATVAGTGSGQMATVNATDEFSVDASITNLNFNSVRGLFSAVETTFDPRTEEINLENGFDQLELVNAVLTLTIHNGVNLPGSLDVLLEGDNGKTMHVIGNVVAGSADSAVLSLIIDSTVASFFTPIPSSIDISGSAIFGDGLTVGTITSDDFVYAEINVLAPLEVRINNAVIDTDIESEGIDLADIVDHVIEARFVYDIVNHLPIGAQFELYMSGDSATALSNPQLLIDDISVPAAPVLAGVVTDTISSGYQQIVLTTTDLDVFANDSLYIGTRLLLQDTPPGETARLTIEDYIHITGRIEVEYNFDGEF